MTSLTKIPASTITDPDPKLSTRRAATISFWIVIILGIPFWWKSTSLERLALPRDQVSYWENKIDCPFHETVSIRIEARTEQTQSILEEVVMELKGIKTPCINLSINEPQAVDAYGIVLVDRVDRAEHSSSTKSSIILLDMDSPHTSREVVQSISTMFGLKSESDERRTKFASKYKLAFSLLNQDSSEGDALLDWDIDELLQKYISPLLSILSPINSFTIETDIQYYAPLSINLKSSGEGSFVEEEVLREFVNSAGWNIASSVTLDPILHFILFIPSRSMRPMHIRTHAGAISKSNAFITPQWGGVVIYNPIITSDTSVDLAYPFKVFELQLRKLLGIPAVPANVLRSEASLESWQIETLIRNRLGRAAKETIGNLGAIVKLSDDIPNMRVGKEVLKDVKSSLRELDTIASTLPDTPSALSHATRSHALSTSAYFNPTMLALLYFPDEHKYAIYTPLFGPVLVPLLIGFVREMKRWLADRKSKLKKLEEEKE